jgi:hypothetical protein
VSILGFCLAIVRALNEIEAPHMIIGAFAATAFGLRRATFGVDIVVDLGEPHLDALAQRFPPPRYYADPEQMRTSTEMEIMFNIIDTSVGAKADLVPLSREPAYRRAFARRIRRTFVDEEGRELEAWCARPEDIVVGKLMAWQEGRSDKHRGDVHEMLVFALSGLSDESLDLGYVNEWAPKVGSEAAQLWRSLREQAEDEVRRRTD